MIVNLYIDEQDDRGYTYGTVEIDIIPNVGDKFYLSVGALQVFEETSRGDTKLSIENRALEIIDKYIVANHPMFKAENQEMEIFAKLLDPNNEIKFTQLKPL